MGTYDLIVLTHRILVSAFLLHYVWKGFLLISDRKDTLAAYTAKTRIAEMVVALGFMLTGIYLVIKGPDLTLLQWAKIVVVFASIPVAIVGFKRGNKMLAVLAVVMLIAAYGMAEMAKAGFKKAKVDTSAVAGDPVKVGEVVYSSHCISCHGEHGDAMIAGAKNLKVTQLNDDQLKDIIHNGKPGTSMNAFKGLTDDQLNGVVAYIKTLK